MSSLPTTRALGIDFFNGTAEEAVAWVSENGGLVVAPAGPSMIALQHDRAYRDAIANADLALADSGWMVNFWWWLRRERLTRISGLRFFKHLLERADVRTPRNFFWILPSGKAQARTIIWSRANGFALVPGDLYIAPQYGKSLKEASPAGSSSSLPAGPDNARPAVEDSVLLKIIQERRPHHIVVAIGGGMQDKIGSYIKDNCGYRPGIYCIGAAPGFVTGDQVRIPMWADRLFVGWIFRVMAQPRVFIPRFWSARRLPSLIRRYGREMPPLL